MKRKALLVFGLAVACAAALVPAASAQAAVTIPIDRSVANGAGTFVGELTVQRFANRGGQLVAIGTLTGTVTRLSDGATAGVDQAVAVPVQATQSTCEILNLVLGPLDLDLLGLQIHLDQVVLVIEAEPGEGNLLGNLLCAIAGLLDNTGAPAGGLAGLLNQILRILG